MSRAVWLVLVTAIACGRPHPPQETAVTATPALERVTSSDALKRAEALAEDLKRREAAQAKFDREQPAVVTPILPSLPSSRPTASPAGVADASTATTATSPAAASTAAPQAARVPAASTRDEAWWKQQMRTLQAALDEALAKLAEAEKTNLKYGYNDAQAEYRRRAAAVADARLAIERLHDEARRAGVSPSWLRP